jgi:hypothetical protein
MKKWPTGGKRTSGTLAYFVAHLWRDTWHGAVWKLGALIGRAWFLFVVFPRLPAGTLGSYIFASTAAMIGGRILACGLDEQLALEIRGDQEKARIWLPLYAVTISIAVLVSPFVVIFPDHDLAWTALLTACFTAHNVMIGLVRSVSPRAFELLANLHVIALAVLASSPFLSDASQLALLLALSLLGAQWAAIRSIGSGFARWPSIAPNARLVLNRMLQGLPKLASNLLLLMSLRGIVIWPKLLRGVDTSDTIAFAVSFGEACWQIGMILVNRTYARLCQKGELPRSATIEVLSRSALLVLVFSILSAGVWLVGRNIQLARSLDGQSIGVLVSMYGPVCVVMLVRYFGWVLGSRGYFIILVLLGWSFVQAFSVLTLGATYWVPAVAASSFGMMPFSCRCALFPPTASSTVERVGPGYTFRNETDRNMRVAYLHQYFREPSESGGTRSYEFARRWVAQGHDVNIVTTEQSRGQAFSGWQVREVEGISVHRLYLPYDNKMSHAERIRAFLKFSLAAGPRAVKIGGDIVFASSTPLTIAIPGIWAARRLGVPMVFEVRDLWPEVPIAMGALNGRIPRHLSRSLEKLAYRHSSAIIALSPGIAEAISQNPGARGIPIKRCQMVATSTYSTKATVRRFSSGKSGCGDAASSLTPALSAPSTASTIWSKWPQRLQDWTPRSHLSLLAMAEGRATPRGSPRSST